VNRGRAACTCSLARRQNLPAVGLRPADGRRYRCVVIVEHFTEQKYSPLDGIQALQSTRNAMEIDSPAHIAVVGSLAASVTIGSGSHWPTYSSRCTRADCR